jgi:hypothetical protein
MIEREIIEREREWLDKTWDRFWQQLEREEERWEWQWRAAKRPQELFDWERRFWYEARSEELRNEIYRQLEIQQERWERELEEEAEGEEQ